MLTILDGPLGSELSRRGFMTSLPAWSAPANLQAPDLIRAIHADYASAGARLHTTNTFRTRERTQPGEWERSAREAVRLARSAIPNEHRVAGSIAPLRDCYRPELTPPNALEEHLELAEVLAEAGADLLLCETFANPAEGLQALRAAISTGKRAWLSLCPGPLGNLMTPKVFRDTAEAAYSLGAEVVMVNCVGLASAGSFVNALAEIGSRWGVYANAGSADDEIGWVPASEGEGQTTYTQAALKWADLGASVIGGCCGLRPEHIASMVAGLEAAGHELG